MADPLSRFAEPYLGSVTDARGRRVKRGGEPTLTGTEQRRAKLWAAAWAEYYETGDITVLQKAGLLPNDAT